MNFRITLIHLQKITIYFLFLIYLSCETQTEKVEPKTYMDLTEAIQNPLDVRVLNLWNNQLTTLPKEIGQLKNLQRLELNNNQLTTLSKGIGQLKNLKKLYLNNNQLSSEEKERIRKLLPKCQIYFE
ncbi:leucine-rich repeat domain-containing protein [Leptospira kirschneri]|uniref:Leucine rich repeat protein n=1 Tax=Leptospira kirschneri serovar Bulgarica str. Nikolaevo TaxID=1240687 RepID=M6FLM7_9LEPT|nr:leucine-rich repeat domain-containing protein [Leptospira kirschneri]EMK23721.1 leucine rich repeat protein [Leptospira kirschneri serovar Bulgarica str. Nikolaevo]